MNNINLSCRPKILAKGFHDEDDVTHLFRSAHVDYVLIYNRLPIIGKGRGKIPSSYMDICVIEVKDIKSLRSIQYKLECLGLLNDVKLLWNDRDLEAAISAYEKGKKLPHNLAKSETFEQAREICKGFLIQASNIKTREDIKPGADAVLVGTHLVEFIESFA